MKDWRNYALAFLALWCVWLTWRTTPSVVWSANQEQEYSRAPVLWWWGRNYADDFSCTTHFTMKDGTRRPMGSPLRQNAKPRNVRPNGCDAAKPAAPEAR